MIDLPPTTTPRPDCADRRNADRRNADRNDPDDLTAQLRKSSDGDRDAFDELLPLVYQHLRRLAQAQLRRRPQDTLDTTALVHEAYLKLAGPHRGSWRDRSHFFAAAAQAMRHILVDAARRRLALKRGAGENPEELHEDVAEDVAREEAHAENVLAVHQALDRMKEIDEQMYRVVECRFFAGLSPKETALALEVSLRTSHRLWARAKAWLRWHLREATAAGNRPGDAVVGDAATGDPVA